MLLIYLHKYLNAIILRVNKQKFERKPSVNLWRQQEEFKVTAHNAWWIISETIGGIMLPFPIMATVGQKPISSHPIEYKLNNFHLTTKYTKVLSNLLTYLLTYLPSYRLISDLIKFVLKRQ